MARRRRAFTATIAHPVTGKRIRLSAHSQRELEHTAKVIDSYREDLRFGRREPEEVAMLLRRVRYGLVTVEAAARAYCRPELSKQTRRNVDVFLNSTGRGIKARAIEALSPDQLIPWIESLRQSGYAVSTIEQAWNVLRAIGAYVSERGWIGSPPWTGWRPKLRGRDGVRPAREAARTVAELVALLLAAQRIDARSVGVFAPPALEPKIAIAALLGLRQGELAGLKWSDIEPGAVRIARQWDGDALKGGAAPVLLRADEALFAILDRYAEVLREWSLYAADGPIFPGPDSRQRAPRHYTQGEVLTRRQLRSAVTEAGLPDVQRWSAHSLRDTFVTLEERAHGGNLARLAERSRHRSRPALLRYLHTLGRDPAPPGFSLRDADSGERPVLTPPKDP